ncbi:hypothetical protein [Sphingobium quisquiliarum]|uniref:hypothetical protein n=1 Tax=Sphingobium quisquiliarum TaxID=538379 RepID=UPI0003FC5377|nr:hypothetical protein [Sphingobium quisquiliarum]
MSRADDTDNLAGLIHFDHDDRDLDLVMDDVDPGGPGVGDASQSSGHASRKRMIAQRRYKV